jgi:uncharacterized protein (TIGR02001 family)
MGGQDAIPSRLIAVLGVEQLAAPTPARVLAGIAGPVCFPREASILLCSERRLHSQTAYGHRGCDDIALMARANARWGSISMWMAPLEAGLVMTSPRGLGGEDLACAQGPIQVVDCPWAEPVDLRAQQPACVRAPQAEEVKHDVAAPARAYSEADPSRVSFNLALVSDYRRAGVTKSAGRPAVQGGLDIAMPSHWSAGARASTIAEHGNVEVLLYGAKSIEVGDAELSFGGSILTYPHAPRSDYAFLQASASRAIGPVDATLAISYAPPQGNLDDRDNFYIVTRARTPIGSVFGLPLTLGASIGRMRGRFAMARTRSDWSLGLSSRISGIDVGLTYVDNDLHTSRGDAAAVLSLAHTF